MTEVEIDRGRLVVRVVGLHKLWALRSRVVVPLAHVGYVEFDDGIARWPFTWRGIRVGTSVPGLVTAGYFYRDGEWTFWDVSDPGRVVVFYLRDEPLSGLVVEVEDPADVVARVRLAKAG